MKNSKCPVGNSCSNRFAFPGEFLEPFKPKPDRIRSALQGIAWVTSWSFCHSFPKPVTKALLTQCSLLLGAQVQGLACDVTRFPKQKGVAAPCCIMKTHDSLALAQKQCTLLTQTQRRSACPRMKVGRGLDRISLPSWEGNLLWVFIPFPFHG